MTAAASRARLETGRSSRRDQDEAPPLSDRENVEANRPGSTYSEESGQERSNIAVFQQDAMQANAEAQLEGAGRSEGGTAQGSRPPSQFTRSSLSTSSTMRSRSEASKHPLTPAEKFSRPPTHASSRSSRASSVMSSRASSRPPTQRSEASSAHDRPPSHGMRSSHGGEERSAQARPVEALRLNLPVSLLPGRESESGCRPSRRLTCCRSSFHPPVHRVSQLLRPHRSARVSRRFWSPASDSPQRSQRRVKIGSQSSSRSLGLNSSGKRVAHLAESEDESDGNSVNKKKKLVEWVYKETGKKLVMVIRYFHGKIPSKQYIISSGARLDSCGYHELCSTFYILSSSCKAESCLLSSAICFIVDEISWSFSMPFPSSCGYKSCGGL